MTIVPLNYRVPTGLLVPCFDEVTKEPSGAFGAIGFTKKSSYKLVMVRGRGRGGTG